MRKLRQKFLMWVLIEMGQTDVKENLFYERRHELSFV